MAVYVDDMMIQWRRGKWSHMTADTLDELHDMASRIGLRREWFQDKKHHQHYDVTMSKRREAIARGAVPLTRREYARKVMKLTGRDKALLRTTHPG